MKKKTKKRVFRLLTRLICLAAVAVLAVFGISEYVRWTTKDDIILSFTSDAMKEEIDEESLTELKELDADCILVLGAGILDADTPSPMLQDRLDAGIRLYREGVAPKILLTGDNGQIGHNEIHVMLNYVKNAGIPEEDIFCDHAGFSTYDSMYRASSIFGVQRAVVVTQRYHEYRAVYIGKALGLEVKGVSSDQKRYSGQFMRDIREILARDKDFFKIKSKAESLLGGEVIPISGSGLVSHGE